jgi:LPS glycosyltransferase icsA
VHDGEDGLLVPPDDPQALADAILSLARNPAHRTHLGDAGRIRVAREHSWESVAAKILALAEET